MRIRLDKLFLSAGLALAVIATTIPAGAAVNTTTSATPEYTLNGETATEAKVAKAVAGEAVETATATSKDGIKYTSTVDATLTDPNSANAGTISDATLNSYLGTDLTAVKKVTGGTVKVEETKTYALSDYKYTKDDEATLEAETASALAAATAALVEVAGASSTNNSTTGGTYAVEVGEVAGEATYTDGDGAALGDDVVNTILVNGLTLQVTKTYTITNLAALGMTYDAVFTDTANADDNLVYSVIKYDGTTVSDVETTEASNGTLASLTDLTATYYLVVKTVSIADDLIFDETDTATVATITQVAEPTAEGKTGIAECIESNSFTPVSYFTITLTSGKTYSDTAITFKIAVPVDVDSNVTYKVLRFHEGNVDILDTTVTDGYIYFTTDKFSDYALVTVAAADTTEEETNNETESATEAGTETTTTTTTAGSSTTSTTTSTKTADNSMMPLFMTTLLLALCAGSLAIYKEKKTN